eukprot:Skav207878  [mRNA]  locus=scaffold664:429090:430280:+ [translate_table: standard]
MVPTKVFASIISWTTWVATLDQVILDFGPQEAADSGLALDYVHNLIRTLQQPSWWSRFFPELVQDEPLDFYVFDNALAEVASREPGLHRPPPAVPRGFHRVRYVLHAYSGRRRFGDVQHYIDLMTKQQNKVDGILVMVLSVDLVIDPRWGNLCAVEAQDHWLSAIKQGQIVGLLAGPPCSTWSRARWVALEAHTGRRGPRPVRSATTPWGDWVLSLKELDQVITGNTLMFFGVRALLELHARGGVGILEHPDSPEDEPNCATIWKTPMMCALLRCPGLDLLQVHQGPYGSEALKPTGLAVLNLPQLPDVLRLWRLSESAVYQQSHGLNQQGQFCTTRLKEYPPALCCAFATAMHQQIHDFPLDPSVILPTHLRKAWEGMLTFRRGSWVGQDFQRTG